MIHKRNLHAQTRGIGMTSQGTRNRLVQRLKDNGISDKRVLQAIANTPRHEFVDEALSSRAYEDTALPISKLQLMAPPIFWSKVFQAPGPAKGDMKPAMSAGTFMAFHCLTREPLWGMSKMGRMTWASNPAPTAIAMGTRIFVAAV